MSDIASLAINAHSKEEGEELLVPHVGKLSLFVSRFDDEKSEFYFHSSERPRLVNGFLTLHSMVQKSLLRSDKDE